VLLPATCKVKQELVQKRIKIAVTGGNKPVFTYSTVPSVPGLVSALTLTGTCPRAATHFPRCLQTAQHSDIRTTSSFTLHKQCEGALVTLFTGFFALRLLIAH
jgi:hypothetical protein